jgi:type III secretory pathway component EscS
MIILLLEFIKLIVISYVLVDLGSFLGEVIQTITTTKNKFLKVSILLMTYLLTCDKCFSFWLCLILTGGNLFIASTIGVSIHFLKKLEAKYIKTKI